MTFYSIFLAARAKRDFTSHGRELNNKLLLIDILFLMYMTTVIMRNLVFPTFFVLSVCQS